MKTVDPKKSNRYTFVWKKVVNKNEVKMFEKIKACMVKKQS